MNLIGCFHYGQEGHFIRDCPQLVVVETSEVGIVAFTPGTSGPSQASRGGCDAPKPGGPLTTRQPAKYKWRSGYPTPL